MTIRAVQVGETALVMALPGHAMRRRRPDVQRVGGVRSFITVIHSDRPARRLVLVA
jgi:hypothetical protein